MSRIYGGIHFMSDNIYGLQVGGEVGQYVVEHELLSPKSGKSSDPIAMTPPLMPGPGFGRIVIALT